MKKYALILLFFVTLLNIVILHFRYNRVNNLEVVSTEKRLLPVNNIDSKAAETKKEIKDIKQQKVNDNLTVKKAKPPQNALTIIIDDIGKSFKKAKEIWDINDNITLSIIPFLKNSVKISLYAKENNLPVMLHMPMEPFKQLPNYKHFLLCNVRSIDFYQTLKENLNSIPYYLGINNHMGSKFTSDTVSMEKFFNYIDKRNLFFIDSRTYKDTVAGDIALEHRVLVGARDVFIDNTPNISEILEQLKYAEKLAIKNSYAIAIGHPNRATIEAIRIFVSNCSVPLINAKKGLEIFKSLEKKHIKEKHESSNYRYRY